MLTSPWPWSTYTTLPLKKKLPVSTTLPAAGAITGLPVFAAMSKPLWGLRGSPLKKRVNPNGLENGPCAG